MSNAERILLVIAIALATLLLLGWALTDRSEAAPAVGNQGGCGGRDVDFCSVTGAGGSGLRRYVDLDCAYYDVPRIFTARRWAVGTRVELWGCVALDAGGQATRLVPPFELRRR